MKLRIRWLALAVGALLVAPAHAKPDCSSDTFSGESSCVYGRKSIGLPGIGNQIVTVGGKMSFHRLISQIGGSPIEVTAVLFRVDDRRTIQLAASNANRPDANCGGSLCTWTWNVVAGMPPAVLSELALAKKLVIGFRGQGRTIEEAELRRGGQIFAKFLDDIRAHEPEVLMSGGGEAYLLEGSVLAPYQPPKQ